jgi:hypothetical protein
MSAKEAPKELNPQQAINILVQAVQLAQKSGVYSLDDAALIKTAVDVFVKKDEQPGAPATAEATAPATEEKK